MLFHFSIVTHIEEQNGSKKVNETRKSNIYLYIFFRIEKHPRGELSFSYAK